MKKRPPTPPSNDKITSVTVDGVRKEALSTALALLKNASTVTDPWAAKALVEAAAVAAELAGV